MDLRRATRDALAGLVFVGVGLAFAVTASSYEVGTTLRMGPGYFPLVVGGLLVLLGILIVSKGLLAPEEGVIGPIAWRAGLLIAAAVILFGLTVRGLGLVPSLFATVLLSGFAGRRAGVVVPVLVAIGLTLTCVLVFIVALQLRLPLIGPWLGI